MPLTEALAQLFKQTGNLVADRRQSKTVPTLKLDLDQVAFWPALDAIAQAAGCGVSTYQSDGQVALVTSAPRPAPVVYQGIFRIVAKKIRVAQDAEAGTHTCTVTLDIAWEPRFEPLYFELAAVQALFSADRNKEEFQASADGQGKINVAGRNALEVDVPLPAARRSAAKIASLAGHIKLTGPGKMLTFRFAPLKVFKKGEDHLEQTQEDVSVRLEAVKASSSLWSVYIDIRNPPGNPQFESYQSWLSNNRISLEKGDGPRRTIWQPRPGDELVEKETAAGANIVYGFPISAKEKKGQPSDWALIYQTPGRIVEIDVPFRFKDLPLP